MPSLDFIPDPEPAVNQKLNTRDKGLADQIAGVNQFDLEHSKIPMSAVVDQPDFIPDFIPDTGTPASGTQPQDQPGLLKQFGQNLVGGVTALEDMVGSLPGLIGAGTAAGVQALQGNKAGYTFPQAVGEVMQSAGKGNLVDYLAPKASLEAARSSPGYGAANKLMMSPFQGFGNIAAFLADASTNDPEFAADIGSRLEAGTLTVAMLGGLIGKVGAKPGTPEFYRELHKEVQSGQRSPEGFGKENIGTYPKEEPKPDFIPDLQDMGAQAKDTGQFATPEPTQFNISPEEKTRLESELNPPVEQRAEGQGELFTGQPALTPDELQARRFVLEEGGTGARDIAQPVEKAFEIGAEVQHPTYTADMVNGAVQHESQAVPEPGIPYEKVNVPLKQRGAIGDWEQRGQRPPQQEWDQRISKVGLTQTMLEQKQLLSRDTRSMAQFVAEERPDPKTIQDLGGFTRFTGPLIDRTINILAQSRTGAGKLVNWIQSNRENITRERDIRTEQGMQNLLQHWRQLPGGFTDRIAARRALHSDLRGMLSTWHDNVGKDVLSREHFKNDRQWNIYKQTHDEIDRNWKETNAAREAAGLKPFDHINNYFPAIWQGDYRIWVKDQAGNNVWSTGVSNKWWGYKIKRDLQKQFPNHIIEDPAHIKTAHEDLPYHDFSASEEGLRLAASNKEAFDALQNAYLKLLYKRGAGASGLHREGMKGYLGMEGGNKGIVNSEKALELWLRRMERHKYNLEINKMQMELHKTLPREIQQKIPRLMEWADDYLANSGGRGAELSRGIRAIDKTFMEMGKFTGFGESFASRSLSNVTGIASLWKVLTLKFATSQIFQPLNVLAKMRQLNIRMPETENFISSFLHAYQGLIWPDKIQERLRDWAGEQGHLSSAVVEMMKMRQKDLSTAAGNVILDNSRLLLSQEEKYIVRIPTLLAFEHMLRDSIPDEKTRFQAAADHLYYIVNYGHESSPLDYAKGGLVGDAARPMKQYAHNFAGQFLEHIQGAVNYKEFSPLAMFVANQVLLSGLRGTILIAEANAITTLINDKFSTNWPTLENWFLKSGMSDAMLFGFPSHLLGADISSSMNAPNLPQMFGMFPVKVAVDAANKVSHYFWQLSQGKATQNDQMDALIAVTPNAMHGWIEEYYTHPGYPVPHPGKMNMQGTHVRKDSPMGGLLGKIGINEHQAASWLSLKGLPEARKDAEMRTFKQMFLNDSKQKLEAIDVITDRVMTHQPVTKDILDQFIKEGGDPNTLMANLQHRIMGRALPFNQQQVIGPEMSMEKLHKLQIMKDALDRQTENTRQSQEAGTVPMSDTSQNMPSQTRLNDTQGVFYSLGSRQVEQFPRSNEYQSLGRGAGQLGQEGIGGLPAVRNLRPSPKEEGMKYFQMRNRGYITRG